MSFKYGLVALFVVYFTIISANAQNVNCPAIEVDIDFSIDCKGLDSPTSTHYPRFKIKRRTISGSYNTESPFNDDLASTLSLILKMQRTEPDRYTPGRVRGLVLPQVDALLRHQDDFSKLYRTNLSTETQNKLSDIHSDLLAARRMLNQSPIQEGLQSMSEVLRRHKLGAYGDLLNYNRIRRNTTRRFRETNNRTLEEVISHRKANSSFAILYDAAYKDCPIRGNGLDTLLREKRLCDQQGSESSSGSSGTR